MEDTIEKTKADPKPCDDNGSWAKELIKFVTDPKHVFGLSLYGEKSAACVMMDTIYDGFPMMYFYVLGSGNFLIVQELDESFEAPKRLTSRSKRMLCAAVKVTVTDIENSVMDRISITDLFKGKGELGLKGMFVRIYDDVGNMVAKVDTKQSPDTCIRAGYGSVGLKDMWDQVPTGVFREVSAAFVKHIAEQEEKKNKRKALAKGAKHE